MINGMRGYGRFLILTGVLALAPVTVAGYGVGYDEALANNAGGNGKGKGQGAAKAGNTGGSVASAGGLAKGQTYDVNGRINSIVKSSTKAWQNASPNTHIGMIAQTFTAALDIYLLAASTDPAAPLPDDLVSILAFVANKELTQEDLDAIEARIAQENPDNLLFQSLVEPSQEPNLQLQTTLQSFDSTLITMVNAVEEPNQGLGKTNQGLGPIY